MESFDGTGWKRPGMRAADYGRSLDHDHDRRVFAGMGEFYGKGPRGFRRSDDSIYEDVCEVLKWDPDVDASEIEVRVEDAVVILDGAVDSRHAKRRAERCLDRISGVHDVVNKLTIKPNLDLTPDKAIVRGDDGLQSRESISPS